MVSEEYPRKVPKTARHSRKRAGDTLFTVTGHVYACLGGPAGYHLRGGLVARSHEYIEIDAQGVVLLKDGKRHILHLWGDTPAAYIPH